MEPGGKMLVSIVILLVSNMCWHPWYLAFYILQSQTLGLGGVWVRSSIGDIKSQIIPILLFINNCLHWKHYLALYIIPDLKKENWHKNLPTHERGDKSTEKVTHEYSWIFGSRWGCQKQFFYCYNSRALLILEDLKILNTSLYFYSKSRCRTASNLNSIHIYISARLSQYFEQSEPERLRKKTSTILTERLLAWAAWLPAWQCINCHVDVYQWVGPSLRHRLALAVLLPDLHAKALTSIYSFIIASDY